MSHVIEVTQNPDKSWTAKGGSSLTVVTVTCLTRQRAAACLSAALTAITQVQKP